MKEYLSTKAFDLGSAAFRQWRAESHCRLIHGYNLTCKIWFACTELDARNWVADFGSFKELKKDLENTFDHTTVVASDDPELDTFKLLSDRGLIDLRIFDQGVGCERFAEYVFDVADKYVSEKTNSRVWVDKVELAEHGKNSAVVRKTDKVAASSTVCCDPGFYKPINTEYTDSDQPEGKTFILDKAVKVEAVSTAYGVQESQPIKADVSVAVVDNKLPVITQSTTGASDWFKNTMFGN